MCVEIEGVCVCRYSGSVCVYMCVCVFYLWDTNRTWTYSVRAPRNMMGVTFSKEWIHIPLSDL